MSKIDILKHGRFYNKKARFTCQCGCMFDVKTKPNELNTDLRTEPDELFGDRIFYICPECNHEVEGVRIDDPE